MEALYHKTNQTVMEIGECFQKLSRFKQSSTDTSFIESEIQEKINFAKKWVFQDFNAYIVQVPFN